MKVNFLANYRLLAGRPGMEVTLPAGCSLYAAVQEICRQIPALRDSWLTEDGQIYGHLNIFINGEDVQASAHAMELILQPGDTLDFLPPVVGG